MRTYPTAVVENGEYVSNEEINSELRSIVSGMNAIDRDHFDPHELGAGRIAEGAFGDIHLDATSAVQDVFIADQDDTQTVRPMPGPEADTPWIVPFTSGDALLKISCSATWQDMTGGDGVPLVWIGIQVDGAIVGQSPLSNHAADGDFALVTANVPVGAGLHDVRFVYGVHIERGMGERQLRWSARNIAIQECAR